MNFTRRLKVLFLLVCIIAIGKCYAQQSSGLFAKFPSETVFNLTQSIGDFTQIICEVSGMTNDTIWVASNIQPPMWKVQANMDDENILIISQDKKGKKAVLKNAFYPLDAIKKGKEGKIEATCIVEEDGSLTDVRIINPIYPSIDAEALRIFSKVKLLPCKISSKPLRCRHKVSVLFEIVDKKNNYARVLVVNPKGTSEGVEKRYKYDVTWTQTTTQTKRDKYGFIENSRSWTSGRWSTKLEIDVPKNNPEFEKLLCKILYGKSAKSIENGGEKFARKFEGKLKNKDFKGVKGNALSVTAHCLSYKAGKYYSYGYEISLKPTDYSSENYQIPYNFIYDIQSKRVLTIADVFTTESIMAMGLYEESYDLGVDEYFIYVGKKGKSIGIVPISQENWNKFSPMFQALLGEKDIYPLSLDKDKFTNKGKLGIQLKDLNQKIVSIPSYSVNNVYLQSYIKENLNLPENVLKSKKSFVANISYVIEKDGTISNVEITQTDDGTEFRDELLRIFQTIPKRQSLVLSNDGPVRSYYTLKYRLSLR